MVGRRRRFSGSNSLTKVTGAIYTGRTGRSALDPTVWSSTSRRLFMSLDGLGVLRRAIGVELGRSEKAVHLARNFSPRRDRWKARFHLHPDYRDAMTRWLDRRLTDDERRGPLLQIGSMFDMARLTSGTGGDGRCYSYHDGCLAERLVSPIPFPSIGRQRIDRALEYERRVSGGMTRVFTFSNYLRESMIRNYGLNAERVVAIGTGLNLDRRPEPDPDKRYDTQRVLFIGADFRRKGGEQLLKAFAAVRESLPRAELHIVGPRGLTISGPQAGGVTVHGFLDKSVAADAARLDGLFREASLFVLPSLYEPFGMAPLEAMAHQIPCLVSNGWALAETVKAGVTGGLVEPGSVDDLAAQMTGMLSDPDRLSVLGHAARRHVDDLPSWEAFARKMAALMGVG
jgi:glycosyltransferase involved in cell wall biosynthesis